MTFFKMSDQIPHYVGQLHGQMPHQSGLKCHCESVFLLNCSRFAYKYERIR